MMRNFIKLANFAIDDNTYIEASTITSIQSQLSTSKDLFSVIRDNDAIFFVKESPDEIMKLIKEALDNNC